MCFLAGCLLHELSNDGARQQFNLYLEDRILPHMVNVAEVGQLSPIVNVTYSLVI